MKPQFRPVSLCLFCVILATSRGALAQLEGVYEVRNKKGGGRKSNRWTLADWLSWKEQQKAMDLWLAKNSHSSLFEFFLESGAANYDRSSSNPAAEKTNADRYDGAVGTCAGNAGLRGTLALCFTLS